MDKPRSAVPPSRPPEVRVTRVPHFEAPPEFPTGGATVFVRPREDEVTSDERRPTTATPGEAS